MANAPLDNPFDALGDAEQRQKAAGRRAKKSPPSPIDNPLADVNPAEARRISARGKSTYHGEFVQVTFRIPAEYKEAIEKIAEAEGFSKEEAKRWAVGTGLQAYARGERPEVVTQVIKTRAKLPEVEL